jgi:putative serine/threonine protein kinase
MKIKGKHSEVFVFGKYAVKVFKKDFIFNFFKETKFLRLLQPFRFVPELYAVDGQELKISMEFIDGEEIRSVLSEGEPEEVTRVIDRSLKICFLLDQLRIQKEELNHPDKHILLRNGDVYFIDFERSHFSMRPSNVTQFATYIMRNFDIGNNKLRDLLGNYKKSYEISEFRKIKDKIVSKLF